MKANPMGVLWIASAGWLNRLPGGAWRTLDVLPEGCLMERMNNFTLLDDAVQAFGGAAEGGWAGKAGRLRQAGRLLARSFISWLPQDR